ncbi:response regulator transcription factor [Brevibacterium sediminis]|uniref:LuxR C-terminal-related transcriptional regulator n=1 Tax=Brevibacterium sediminis TaxID=1857024 RepID=UPI002175172B|nr:response regulator transcription factor [Brevibacterium sediminis]MCS4591626.1 response regulator transcription factor [Brevibacterium sediminis]
MRIVLAEDTSLLRAGLETLLARFGHDVVAAVADADALRQAAQDLRPDLVLTDVRMPPDDADDGLRAAIAIREHRPDQSVLVLSQYIEQSYAEELLASQDGVGVGYLLKDRVGDVRDFVAAVQDVADGGTVIDTDVVRHMVNRRRDPLESLSRREHEVLALMAAGRSNAAIARNLYVSEAAVNKHIGSIFTKLGLHVAPDDHRRVLAVLAFLRR